MHRKMHRVPQTAFPRVMISAIRKFRTREKWPSSLAYALRAACFSLSSAIEAPWYVGESEKGMDQIEKLGRQHLMSLADPLW
jgi:hypothetical protein